MRVIKIKNRTNLEKYFKQVRVCKICKREYGLDDKDDYNNVCPVCHQKMLNLK